ncbi:MAG: hypothetical protein CMM39_02115 [Rhodospirillaceae bacterium]|nr:hypothetical protein [Rhodospirillaceae bacterium]
MKHTLVRHTMSQPLARYIGLSSISTGVMIGPLDTSVNIAFPHIVTDFNEPMEMTQWVVICYVLTYASLMLIFGKLGDLYGQRRIFCIGLIASIFALLLISTADSFNLLLFFRFLQGVGIGLVTSVAPAMMIALYPEEKRAYAVGLFTLFFALGGLLGPIIGGVLINLFDWRAVFWFRIPISFLSLILVLFIPNKRIDPKQTKFDWVGAISLVFFLVACLLTINQFHSVERQGFWPVLIYASVAMISIYVFVRQERRANDPILDLKIFSNINFVIINLASCLLYSMTFSVILIIPFLLYKTSTISTNEAGFILSVGFIGASLAGLISGRLIGALKSNYISFLGILITGIGLSLIGYTDPSTGLFWMILAISLQGIGTGLFQSSYLFIVTGLLPVSQRGVSGSIVMLTRTIGVVSGVSMLTLGFAWLNKINQETGINPDEVFNKSFQQIFVLAGGVLLLFLLATLTKPTIWFGKSSE